MAGGGEPADGLGDDGLATSARLSSPRGVAVDVQGHLYIAESNSAGRIRRVDAVTGVITTVAGGGSGSIDDGRLATAIRLSLPNDVAIDGVGHLYIAENGGGDRIRRVDASTGVITTIAGGGSPEDGNGDGGLATSAKLSTPGGITFDDQGHLYIVESSGVGRVRRVDALTGVITTVAGGGNPAVGNGDGGLATSAKLSGPSGVAIDVLGHLYVVDGGLFGGVGRIRRVDALTGVITTVAGGGNPAGGNGDGGLATSAELSVPRDVAIDGEGHLYIAEGISRVRRVDANTGVITTVAGGGSPADGLGDGGLATSARLSSSNGLAIDDQGHLYVTDRRSRIRRVDALSGVITTLAGASFLGFSGDGGLATSARLSSPRGLAIDGQGHLYIADRNNGRVRRVNAETGVVTTVAGASGTIAVDFRALVAAGDKVLIAGGTSGVVQRFRESEGLRSVAGRYPHPVSTGDLARFRSEGFGSVGGVAFDSTREQFYFTETTHHRIYEVTMHDPANDVSREEPDTWTIDVLAGVGGEGFDDGGDNPLLSRWRLPMGLYLDETQRELYVADSGNHVIRRIDLSLGAVTTVAGIPESLGNGGDNGPALEGTLANPAAVTFCPNGDLFIADTGNHRVRRVAAQTSLLSTVLGVDVPGSSGSGAPSRFFPVDSPLGLTCDGDGNVYVTSRTVLRQLVANGDRVVDGSGSVATIYGGDSDMSFPASATRCLTGVDVEESGVALVADSCLGFVVRLELESVSEP